MNSVTVKFCVKNPKSYVNYHTSSIVINNDKVNFPMKINIEEVISLKKKERKQYKKIIQSFIGTSMSFLMLTSRSMAATSQTTPSLPSGGIALPPDLMEPLMQLIGLAIGGSVVLSILLMIAAGTMRQFRKKKEAVEWTTDIIKGFMQILISVPLIFLIYYIATLLLGNFQMFLKPL